ncbi:MAG: ABC transporter ATP-binding protein, partial [Gemmatimonadota bacterium]
MVDRSYPPRDGSGSSVGSGGEGAGPGGSGAPVLEIRDLHKSYREGETTHAVLRGATATVERGELVALLGPSGSGKSTLLNLVSGIDTPDSGEVRLDGRSLVTMTERDRTLLRRRQVGFVFQFFNLLPTLTVEENLLLPLELTGAVPDEARERASSLLRRVGLGDRGDSFPDRLSGGEQQRVAVVRALVHRPSLV